jgi:hypothetical protein
MRSERDIVPVYTSFSDQKQGVGAFDGSYATLLISNVIYWEVEHFFAFQAFSRTNKIQ